MRTIVMRNGTNYEPSHNSRDYLSALGYLSNWGAVSRSYEYVELSVHSDGDIAAAYHPHHEAAKKANRPAYFIMAVRDNKDGSYSFHS